MRERVGEQRDKRDGGKRASLCGEHDILAALAEVQAIMLSATWKIWK